MPSYCSVRTIAEVLGVSPWTVYQAIAAGRIPAHRLKPTGRLFLVADEVKAALQPSPAVRRRLKKV
jgi:excisionase family DNA binding protein